MFRGKMSGTKIIYYEIHLYGISRIESRSVVARGWVDWGSWGAMAKRCVVSF